MKANDKHCCFISYSTGNNDEAQYKFITDLSNIVINQVNNDKLPIHDNLFFIDRTSNNRNELCKKIHSAIVNSRIYICVLSKHYFDSIWCGQEFSMIKELILSSENKDLDGKDSQLIFIKYEYDYAISSKLIEVQSTCTLKFSHEINGAGDKYNDKGIAGILREDDEVNYNKALLGLSKYIVEALRKNISLTCFPRTYYSKNDFIRYKHSFCVFDNKPNIQCIICAPTCKEDKMVNFGENIANWKPFYLDVKDEIITICEEASQSIHAELKYTFYSVSVNPPPSFLPPNFPLC